MKFMIYTGAITLPLVVGIPLLRHGGEADMKAAEPVVAAAHEASSGSWRICAPGVVEGACREIGLEFQAPGRLASIAVAEGDRVREGDVLARLDDEAWQAELAQAEASLRLALAERARLESGTRQETLDVLIAEVNIARVRVRHAERNLQRVQRLVRSSAVTEQEADDCQAAYESAQAEVSAAAARVAEAGAKARADDLQIADAKIEVAQAKVRQAREMLERCVLRAPRNGIVARVMGEPGELVSPSTAVPLITIQAAESLRVRTFVEELDAVHVAPEMMAEVTVDALPGQRFAGRVLSCSPVMGPKVHLTHQPGERQDVKVREVLVVLDDQDAATRLVIGLPVEVQFR